MGFVYLNRDTGVVPDLPDTSLSTRLRELVYNGEHRSESSPHLFPQHAPVLGEILSAESFPGLATADRFVQALRMEVLGENPPPLPNARLYRYPGSRPGSGFAETGLRQVAFGGRPTFEGFLEKGLAVHELIHATGFRRITNSASYGVTQSHTLTTTSQSGWCVEVPIVGRLDLRSRLFDLLEEVTASCAEQRFYRDNGGSTVSTTRAGSYTYKLDDPADELEHKAFQALQRAKGKVLTNNGEASCIEFETSYARFSDSESVKTKYDSVRPGLMRLAPELYPESISPNDAARMFEQDLLKSHMTGNLRPVLDRISKAFGPGAVRFFARLETDDASCEGSASHRSSRILQLFGDAKALPPDECIAVRSLLMRSLDIDWGERIARQSLPPREEILGRLAMGTPTEAAKEAIAVKLASEEQIYSAATEGFNQLLAGGLNPSPLGFLSNSQLSWDRVLKGPHNQTIFSNLVKGMISSPMTTHWEWNTACQIVEELGGQRVLSPEDASALLAKIRSNKESDAISVLRFVSTFGLEQQAANDIGFRTDILERLRNDSDPCQLLSKVNATLPLTRAEWSELFEAPDPAPGERPFSVAVAGGFKWLSSGEQEQLLKAVPVEFQINWKRDPF